MFKNALLIVTLTRLQFIINDNGIVCTDAFSPSVPTHQHQQRGPRYITESSSLLSTLTLRGNNLRSITVTAAATATSTATTATTTTTTTVFRKSTTKMMMAKYGPQNPPPATPDSSFSSEDEEFLQWERDNESRVSHQRLEFRALLTTLTSPTTPIPPENLPRILSQNVALLLDMRGYEGAALVKEAIEEAEATGDEGTVERVMGAVDYIATFVEEFVGQAKEIDDRYKKLLGRIVRCMAEGGAGGGRDAEAEFDRMMKREKDNFTPGFLRHLEGECRRIASAPRMSPESARMQQTVRLIQTRILEELGEDLGEGALVLSQLLGYDDRNERLAVLSAGLTVRGVDFADELKALTDEALDGFERVPGGVDPHLVQIIKEIDQRIQSYIHEHTEDPGFQ